MKSVFLHLGSQRRFGVTSIVPTASYLQVLPLCWRCVQTWSPLQFQPFICEILWTYRPVEPSGPFLLRQESSLWWRLTKIYSCSFFLRFFKTSLIIQTCNSAYITRWRSPAACTPSCSCSSILSQTRGAASACLLALILSIRLMSLAWNW